MSALYRPTTLLIALLLGPSMSACGHDSARFQLPPFQDLSAPERRPATGPDFSGRVHHVAADLDRSRLEDRLLRGPGGAALSDCYQAWRRSGPRAAAKLDLAFAFADGRFPIISALVGASRQGLDRALERCLTGWISSPQTWLRTPRKTGDARVEVQFWP